MDMPKYVGFFADLKKIYDSCNAEEFTVGSAEDTVWKGILTAMNNLLETAENPDVELQENAWTEMLRAFAQCRVYDLSELSLLENDSAENRAANEKKMDAYNRAFSETLLPRWHMQRLGDTLYHQVTGLGCNEKLQADQRKMGRYIKSYSEILDDLDSFDDQIDAYKDYDTFYQTYTDAVNAQTSLRKALEDELRDGETTPEIEQYNVEMLGKAHDALSDKFRTLRREVDALEKDLMKKEKDLEAAQKAAEEVKKNASEIEAEHKKQQEILKEKEAERNAQALSTQKAVSQAEKVSNVITEVKGKSFEADRKLEQINKDYKKTTGVMGAFRSVGGLFSKKLRDANEKAKKDHEALSWLKDQENAEKLLNETEHAFDELIGQKENFTDMLKIGEFIHKNEKIGRQMLENDSNNHYNRRCKEVYLTRERLKNTMLKMFGDYDPSEKAMEKFNERMQTPEGLVKMARELRDLAKKDVENKLKDSDIKENILSVTSILETKKASEIIAASSEEEIAGMQNDMLRSGNALRREEESVKDQEKVVRDASMESKLAAPIARQKAEADKYMAISAEKDQMQEKLNGKREELEKVSNDIRRWEKRLALRKKLDEKTAEVEKHKSLYNKVSSYMSKCNKLATDGQQLKKDLDISALDKYGKTHTDKLAVDTYLGLKALHDTALVGKEHNHNDTTAYRGMMDKLDELMDNRGSALDYLPANELKQNLSALKQGAQNYITAKNNQHFAFLRHSPMRKARLDFANQLIAFCDKQTELVNAVSDKIGNMQDLYDNFVKTGVNGWNRSMEMKDAFAGIQKSRKTKLDLNLNKAHQTYRTKVNTLASNLIDQKPLTPELLNQKPLVLGGK